MANIYQADYSSIPKIAKTIRELGLEMNTAFEKIYKKVENLRKYWYGSKYNKLVSMFNELAENVNEMLKMVVTDIPTSLGTVAYNYAVADHFALAKAQVTKPRKIGQIEKANQKQARFKTTEVETVRKNIESQFNQIQSKMNEIEKIYSKLSWISDASKTHFNKFSKLKTTILKNIDSIKSSFTKFVKEASASFEQAENANKNKTTANTENKTAVSGAVKQEKKTLGGKGEYITEVSRIKKADGTIEERSVQKKDGKVVKETVRKIKDGKLSKETTIKDNNKLTFGDVIKSVEKNTNKNLKADKNSSGITLNWPDIGKKYK